MKASYLQTFIVICCLLLPSLSHAQFYRWVDENGRVFYSDKLPASDADKAHDQVNESGIPLESFERAKSAEERAAARDEEARLSEERKAIAAAEARQRAKDKILLDTFSSEEDLLYTRDDRLTAIQSLINLTESNNTRLQERLDVSRATEERLTKANRDIPQNILDTTQSLVEQIEKNNLYISAQQEKYQAIATEFDQDLARYRELKGLSVEILETSE